MAAGAELQLESWPRGSPRSPAPRRRSRCPRSRARQRLAVGALGPFEPGEVSDIVHPVKVDESGSFLSYDLSHRALHRRSLSSKNKFLAFYELHYKGQPLKFNLSLNINLLTPGFVSERRYGGIADAKIQSHTYNSCHMIGEVQSRTLKGGLAALSTCDGLKGVFQLMNEDYFIEPVATSFPEDAAAQPHRIYKRHAPEHPGEQDKNLEKSEKRRERWEQKQYRKRRIKQRSISKEKWVETLVVADTKMIEYHGSENIEKYVLTVMNMVAGLFHHASIGNPINIAIVRLILLENEEEDLKISHHADNTLKSFCKWQKSINVKGDSHPLHHDVAVLLTRKDICAAMNRPCETLGLSHVAGMCQPHRSCNINEDTGLPLAFTVAHELGHSFGIQHDGSSNDCEPVGKRPFIMSPQLLYDTSPLTWSRCSREYITRFLDRGWGLCLDDPPAREVLDFPLVPPGVLYDVSHQCRLQYGAYSTFCDDMDSVCNTLWCTVGTTCHSKLDAAVDGTTCGENKWCFNGECVPVGYRPDAINGNWGPWSSWAACSRSCGAGVQSAERQCNNPTPKYGGRYCLGERKRFRICNIKPCPPNKPSFRQVQCSQFNPMLYKGKLYKWTPVPNNINPCELHCRPEDEYFAEKLRDAVIDGTPCYEMNSSRDMCINGICKNVGCDYEIDSNAVEDRCGVCHGDGSTCHTVKKTFEDSEGLGYVDIGIIPVGAREIRIEEVAEAGNFLALRSEDPEKYFLNGGWTIQWNGDYRVAGTTFTYERTGNWENLTSPGPTVEPVWIQLLFQETNPGVRYQYTIQRPADSENEIERAEFLWRFGSWTTCTATCGTGVQRQIVHCVEKLAGIVEEQYCDTLTRPDDKQRTCNEEPCPARWWVGEWQKCSATCGTSGLMKRTVLCIQSVGLDEQRALQQADCQHLSKPEATAPCHRDVPCPSQWAMGNWSECSATCGNGTQRRPVYCSNNTQATCDPAQRPSSETICSLPQCQKKLDNANTDWSGMPLSPTTLGPLTQLTAGDLMPQGALVPDMPPSPAHSPPTGASPSKPSAVPGAKWGPRATQVPYHTVPASPSTQQHSSMAPVSHTAPEEHSLPAAPGTLVYGAGEHEGPQPTPTSPPVWEQEEALLLPPTTIAATAVPSWEVGNWSEVCVGSFHPMAMPCGGTVWFHQHSSCELSTALLSAPGVSVAAHVLQCSATCGVGAIWRSVRCSTGTEEHCTAASKPVPARRCSLRPCSSWRVGNWSKCSKNCGRGTKVRDVHCVDTREQRLLRPFHCQAVLYKPLAQLPCQNAPCLDWYTSSWRECSEPCGGGEQERLVTCPELGHCDETLRPNNTRPCNSHPCTKWVVGSWGQCSVPCGGGIQRRQVKCINTQTGQAQEDSSLCDHEPWPESTQKCNLQNCEGTEAGFVCERDRLTFGFCQTLRVLGRCHLPTVHVQCCQSCRQHGHHGAPDQDRGDERASRR
uniref:ADAM metallopeptidase with thrombospondin type 1 motif 7 n=1 Tax=Phasianus colchicus TaxID=9054 RepID=A0A669PGR4_PHACC